MTMRNWKFLVELLAGRPHRIGAEVGVFEGECALGLLSGLPNLQQLLCIDPWEVNEDFQRLMPCKQGKILTANWDHVLEKYLRTVVRVHQSRVVSMRMTSLEAAELVEGESLDFAFIDANHAYEFVKPDIDMWTTKVKAGGIICGDDFKDKPNYGVKQAVKECFGDNYRVDRRSAVWYAVKGS